MTILGRDSGSGRVIGQINTDYSSLSTFGSARSLNVYSSIGGDISSLIASSTIAFVNWQVIFAFDGFPTYPLQDDSALPSADFGTWTTARFGQQSDNGQIRFQCMRSPTFGYIYGTGSATYPRGRYNLPNVGTVNYVVARNVADVQVQSISADIMYIKSPFAESGAGLQLQIQYILVQWNYSAASRSTLDI